MTEGGAAGSVTGDGRLSGVGKKGAKVGARYDVKGSTNPTALITATGPMQLIERDTKAHTIPKPRRRGRKRYAVIDGHAYASAQHPGTRGKRPFEKGWRRAAPQAPAVFQAAVRDAVRRGWGL